MMRPETAVEASFFQRQCQCKFGGEVGLVGRLMVELGAYFS